MKLRLVAPLALLLVAGCGTDLTTAGGPGVSADKRGVTERMERDGGGARERHRLFRRPSYPRRDS